MEYWRNEKPVYGKSSGSEVPTVVDVYKRPKTPKKIRVPRTSASSQSEIEYPTVGIYDSKKKKTVQTVIAKSKGTIESEEREEVDGVSVFEAFNESQFEIGYLTIAPSQQSSSRSTSSAIHAFFVQSGNVKLKFEDSKEFVLATGSVFYVPNNTDNYVLHNTTKRIVKLVYFTSK